MNFRRVDVRVFQLTAQRASACLNGGLSIEDSLNTSHHVYIAPVGVRVGGSVNPRS